MANRTNGVDLDTLTETLGELKKDPELGRSVFRASNRWLGSTRSVSHIHSYYAVKQEMEHAETFEVPSDEPPIIAGSDTAPNPVEYLLAALASCVTSAMVLHAAVQDIRIGAIESEVEGDLDVNGLAGLSDAPKGYQQIRLKMRVESDADADTLRELAHFSPTLDTVTRGTPVEIDIDRQPLRQTRAAEQTAQP